jgi:hypothetical protein
MTGFGQELPFMKTKMAGDQRVSTTTIKTFDLPGLDSEAVAAGALPCVETPRKDLWQSH